VLFIESDKAVFGISQAAAADGWSSNLFALPHNYGGGGDPRCILDALGCLQVFTVSHEGSMWNIKQESPAPAWGN
jgi:hypothetical protein